MRLSQWAEMGPSIFPPSYSKEDEEKREGWNRQEPATLPKGSPAEEDFRNRLSQKREREREEYKSRKGSTPARVWRKLLIEKKRLFSDRFVSNFFFGGGGKNWF